MNGRCEARGSRREVRQVLLLVVGAGLLVMTLYSLAGMSDRPEQLTAQQRAEVVGRWQEAGR